MRFSRMDNSLGTVTPSRWALPVPRAAIIGREQEIDAVVRLLADEDARLLTLTGPGGVGKTRLALEVAHRLADNFHGRVWWVDLASVRHPGRVLPAIAARLGVREGERKPLVATLAKELRDRQALLVLDNVEQVCGAAPELVELVARCPRLRILATSRRALEVRAERLYPVEPLAVPAPDEPLTGQGTAHAAAMALFAERASSAHPGLSVTEDNAAVIADICRRLDGLPLAIELAASRAADLALTELRSGLEAHLSADSPGSHHLPARQRTMERTIDWSYGLLDAAEQALFRRLGVCAGGFSLGAAVAVAGCDEGETSEDEVLQRVSALAAQSLLQRVDDPDGEPRFRMLELTRSHALDRLRASGETDAARRCHASYFLELVGRAEVALRGPGSGEWMHRLEADHDNLRAALAWTLEAGETRATVALAAALGRFWYVRGRLGEGRAALEDALAVIGDADIAGHVRVLGALVAIAGAQGDDRREAELAEEALALAQTSGDERSIAWSLHGCGNVAQRRGDLDAAARWYEEALVLFRRGGDEPGAAAALNNLGLIASDQGDAPRAIELLEGALQVNRRLGNQRGVAIALCNIGQRVLELEGSRLAARYYREALPLLASEGDYVSIAWGLQAVARIAAMVGATAEAARLYGAVDAHREAIGWRLPASGRDEFDREIDALRERMGERAMRTAWSEGRRLSIGQAVAAALSVVDEVERGEPQLASEVAPLPAGLTDREVDVLRLVAAGLTNVQIADRLGLSRHTIDAHLRRIFRKLDVRTRTAAARFAVEHDLD